MKQILEDSDNIILSVSSYEGSSSKVILSFCGFLKVIEASFYSDNSFKIWYKNNNFKNSVGLTFSEFHIKVEIKDTNFQKTAGQTLFKWCSDLGSFSKYEPFYGYNYYV